MEKINRPLNLLVLEGDGIGPEIVAATLSVLDAASIQTGTRITLKKMDIGFKALKSQGTTMPASTTEAAWVADGVILGPVSHDEYL